MSLRTLSLDKKTAERLAAFLEKHKDHAGDVSESQIEIRMYGYDIEVVCHACRWKAQGYSERIRDWDEDNKEYARSRSRRENI